jgi:predicted dithiol-disulfide oxidoreductase (DUF899 family)
MADRKIGTREEWLAARLELLDWALRGRNETRTDDAPLNWFRRHDEYESQ